jgi:hypothetical protein
LERAVNRWHHLSRGTLLLLSYSLGLCLLCISTHTKRAAVTIFNFSSEWVMCAQSLYTRMWCVKQRRFWRTQRLIKINKHLITIVSSLFRYLIGYSLSSFQKNWVHAS